jgi:hypothetical protein
LKVDAVTAEAVEEAEEELHEAVLVEVAVEDEVEVQGVVQRPLSYVASHSVLRLISQL